MLLPDNPRDEIQKTIPHLSHVSIALIEFSELLSSSTQWELGYNRRWTITPKKFVSFQVQRTLRRIRFTVRGQVGEFPLFPELTVKPGRAGSYSEFPLTSPKQLAAASFYIRRAFELYNRGGGRAYKGLVIQEI